MPKEKFRKISTFVSNIAGSAWAFSLAFLVVLVWALSGKLFNYSDTWQLVINTGTTIITFLMVFLIQSTQNRDSKAMQLKLDELLRVTRARHKFIDIEDLSDDELAELAAKFSKIRKESSDPLAEKFYQKLQVSLTKRRELPGEKVATQVVSLLNPFTPQPIEKSISDKKDIDKTNSVS